MSTTHIVLVGHTRETLIGSLRKFPVDRVVLVYGVDESAESEKVARDVGKKLRKDMGSISCEDVYLDLDDVSAVALGVSQIVSMERELGREVLINLSGSLRSAGVGAYLSSLLTGARAYIGLPEYGGNKIVGVREVRLVPQVPLKEFSSEKKEILLALKEGPKLMGALLGTQSESERSRLSYHLKDLKKDGLVETVKVGRNLKVSLSVSGSLYVARFCAASKG